MKLSPGFSVLFMQKTTLFWKLLIMLLQLVLNRVQMRKILYGFQVFVVSSKIIDDRMSKMESFSTPFASFLILLNHYISSYIIIGE